MRPELLGCTPELEGTGRRIGETAARMAEMVQNLLDANRIERGEMQLAVAQTEFGSVLQSVTRSVRIRLPLAMGY